MTTISLLDNKDWAADVRQTSKKQTKLTTRRFACNDSAF